MFFFFLLYRQGEKAADALFSNITMPKSLPGSAAMGEMGGRRYEAGSGVLAACGCSD